MNGKESLKEKALVAIWVVAILVTLFSIILIGINSGKINRLRGTIDSKFNTSVMESDIYYKVDIETANIVEVDQNGFTVTDKGKLLYSKPENSKEVLVFTDVFGDLRLSNYIDTCEDIHYVTKGYEIPENGFEIESEEDRLLYYSYTIYKDKLATIERNREVCILAGILGLFLNIMVVIPNIGTRKKKPLNTLETDKSKEIMDEIKETTAKPKKAVDITKVKFDERD